MRWFYAHRREITVWLSLFPESLPSACMKRFFFFMLSYATLSLKFLLHLILGLLPAKPVPKFSHLTYILLKVPLPSSFG